MVVCFSALLYRWFFQVCFGIVWVFCCLVFEVLCGVFLRVILFLDTFLMFSMFSSKGLFASIL